MRKIQLILALTLGLLATGTGCGGTEDEMSDAQSESEVRYGAGWLCWEDIECQYAGSDYCDNGGNPFSLGYCRYR
ncbi:MAG: hypothetical protein H6729_11770 [Deltaproteobacteria bacterium]|nr:hypothetical protein [Deltaproteobacteria bacterium]